MLCKGLLTGPGLTSGFVGFEQSDVSLHHTALRTSSCSHVDGSFPAFTPN